jgi:hypothetical protein
MREKRAPTRWPAATPAALLVVAAVVAAPTGLHFFTRARVGAAYRDLLTCLAGPIDVSAEDAARAVRRRRWRDRPDELQACATTAQAVADDRATRWHAPELVEAASDAAAQLREGRVPENAEAVWRAGQHLGAHVAADPLDGRAPAPLIDHELAALRANRAFEAGEWAAAQRGAGRSALLRDGVELSRWVLRSDTPSVIVARAKEVPAGDVAREVRLRARGEPALRPVQTCSTDKGDALVISDGAWAGVYRLEDDPALVTELDRSRLEPPASMGALSLGCDGETIRVAWVRSDPTTPPEYGLGADVELPRDEQRHQLEVLSCSREGCSRQVTTVMGLEVMWGSVGGWSSPWALQTPDTYVVGDRVLLLWETGTLLRYRFGRPEQLAAAQNETLAEIAPRDAKALDPRAIHSPRFQTVPRDRALLLRIVEDTSPPLEGGRFLVRFEASGAVAVVRPPAP